MKSNFRLGWVFLCVLMSQWVNAGDRDISKVLGGITVDAGESVGDISSVNGGVSMKSQSLAKDVETVNGRVSIGSDVRVTSVQTVNGHIEAEERLTVERGLRTVNGGIELKEGSSVGKNVETVNGNIELTGASIEGNLTTTNGDIELQRTHVSGDVIVREDKGNRTSSPRPVLVKIDANTVIEGKIHLHRKAELEIEDGAKVGEVVKHYQD